MSIDRQMPAQFMQEIPLIISPHLENFSKVIRSGTLFLKKSKKYNTPKLLVVLVI